MDHIVQNELVSDSLVAQFEEIGAVRLQNAFDSQWVQSLQDAIEERISGEGDKDGLRDEFTQAGANGRFVSELFPWRSNPVFKKFLMNSLAAEIAGAFLGASRINLLFDQILVKEPGTNDRTNWHQDLPFWPVSGKQVLTIWLALDNVSAESGAVQFIPGSHMTGKMYRPEHPAAGPDSDFANVNLPRCPDFDKDSNLSETITWDLKPGDCYVFNSRTIHGAAGNSSTTSRRRGYATRWTGDDARFVAGRHVLSLPEDPGLQHGALLDSDLFPVVWNG